MKFTHSHFNFLFVVLCLAVVGFFAASHGPEGVQGIVGNLAGIAITLSVYVIFCGLFSYFFCGKDFNVPHEIVANKNLALAVFLGLFFLGAGWVIAKGLI